MRKVLIFGIVVLAIVGVVWVLSIDDDPPDDAHLLLVEPPVSPDATNGFDLFLESIDLIAWPEDDAWIRRMTRRETARDPAIAELLRNNRQALALIPEAVAAPVFDIPPTTDLEDPPYLEGTRRLAHLVSIEVGVRLARGERGALEGYVPFLALMRRLQAAGEILHYLIGSAYANLALQYLSRDAADTDGRGLEAIAQRLSAFAWNREIMENALRREYMAMTRLVDDQVQQFAWRNVPLVPGYLYQTNRTRALYAESVTAALDALDEDCSTALRESERPPPPKWRYVAPNALGRIFHGIGPDLIPFTFSRCRDQMSLGLTQLVLALRAYRARAGKLPDDLAALVPRYLAALPKDIDGRPFRYSAEGAYVYSIGEDRLDDGGGEPTLQIDWNDPDPGASLRDD